MKLAFLLMIHENPIQANYFITQLLSYPDCDIFIHVDSKSKHIIPDLKADDRVHILDTSIDGQWGDYTQMVMIDALLEASHQYGHFDYYSLHSGSDMAVRPITELVSYLQDSRRYAYYSCGKLPVEGWGHGGGMERLALDYPAFFRRKYKLNHPLRYLRALYQLMYEKGLLKGKKLPEQYQFYGGSEWFTVSRECLEDYFQFKKEHPDYDQLFRNALAGDEIYYVSIFEMMRNGREAESENNLTYIDWSVRQENEYAGSPNLCTVDRIRDIEASERFFARKFDWSRDRDVIDYYMGIAPDNSLQGQKYEQESAVHQVFKLVME